MSKGGKIMAQDPEPTKIDLSHASDDDLKKIHNEVVLRLATRAKTSPDAAGHDSHGSSHSKNNAA
jgi:hypothetical protein